MTSKERSPESAPGHERGTWLRRPGEAELPSLSALCLRSKATWGYSADFLAACEAELTLTPRDLAETALVVAEDGAGVLGVAQVSVGVDGQTAWLEKLFVEPSRQRSGAGRRLYEWATRKAVALGAAELVIEADPGAVAFYERMGARRDGDAPSGSISGRLLPRLVHPL